MIYRTKPENFNHKLCIVGCFVQCEGELLFLLRPENKFQGGKWGVPGGKIEKGETKSSAMSRELKEETGLEIYENEFEYLSEVYVRWPNFDFVYTIFSIKLETKPIIKVREGEHIEFVWKSAEDSLNLSLVDDEDACIKILLEHERTRTKNR